MYTAAVELQWERELSKLFSEHNEMNNESIIIPGTILIGLGTTMLTVWDAMWWGELKRAESEGVCESICIDFYYFSFITDMFWF